MDAEFNLGQSLIDTITRRLGAFDIVKATDANQKAAAVVLAISDAGHGANLAGMPQHETWSKQGALILTKRSRNLRRHAGQWALPGGKIDEGETAEQAALRELAEEVALHRDETHIIGRLDDVITMSGFVMTPIVVIAGEAREMTPNPDEVDRIHRIPFTELLRSDAPILDNTDESEHPVLRMPVGESWIAAPTAAILYQFREVCLLDKKTRVANFGQPRFTWK
jgi:8-oxo-dGTP pyrophosphatase MutT (NUDIX family)